MKVRIDVPILEAGGHTFKMGEIVDLDDAPELRGAIEAGLVVDAGEPTPKRSVAARMRLKHGA